MSVPGTTHSELVEHLLDPHHHVIFEMVEDGWRATKLPPIGVFCATASTIHGAHAAVDARIRSAH